MSTLYEASAINKLVLKNRFVRSATWEGLATPAGEVTPRLIEMMTDLARGGVGLIISSHAYVSPEGQGTPWQLGVYKDELVPGLKQLTAAVHASGGKIVMQLAHAGQYAETQLTGRPALAVSDSAAFFPRHMRVIPHSEMPRIVTAFCQAAGRAREAGFDGIEIHAGHGYLLSQFLSPAYNQRQDDYGGSIGNRTRIHRQVYQALREVVGADYPVLIKMNCTDLIEQGLTIEDALQAAKLFDRAGFDALELSGGIIKTGKLSPSRPGINAIHKEAYFQDHARRFKNEIKTPLILVGGLRSFEVADRIVSEGIADYISMSRPFIREPNLIDRWQRGDRRQSGCTSDNLCFQPGFEGRGVYCVARERRGRVLISADGKNSMGMNPGQDLDTLTPQAAGNSIHSD